MERKESNAFSNQTQQSAFSQNPEDVIWVNASKTGRGATLSINGELYATSIQSLQKLVQGETKGAKFVKIIKN